MSVFLAAPSLRSGHALSRYARRSRRLKRAVSALRVSVVAALSSWEPTCESYFGKGARRSSSTRCRVGSFTTGYDLFESIPDWAKHAMAAPLKRNDQMLEALPAGLVAFPGSGISANLADNARKLGALVWHHSAEGAA
jgi:hypothetical protein